MRPNVEAVCRKMAEDLLMRVLPEISPSYHQGTVGMVASIFSIIGEEWDRSASRRIEENDRLRELFREAAPFVSYETLRRRLTALAATKDSDFHISALEKNNCDLRAALIELHAYVETQTGPEARRIEAVIWKELLESIKRRRLLSAQF
jgi:hypothetical protein